MFVEHKEVGEDKKLDEASKLLLKAAQIIEERGLWQGGTTGGRCVLTALIDAEGRVACLGPNGDEAFQRFWMAIGATGNSEAERTHQVYRWNDAQTNKDAVTSRLRAVALAG